MTLLVAVISAEHLEREAVFEALAKRGAKPVFGSERIIELPVNGLDGVSVVFHSVQAPGKPHRAASAYRVTRDLLGEGGPRFDLAIFVGTAGALDTKQEFPIGQVVIPREVVWAPGHPEIAACGGSAADVVGPDPDLVALADDSPVWRSADRLVTVDHVVSTESERVSLLKLDAKPLVVAMEDAGFFLAARSCLTPAVSVRAVMDHITDRANEGQKDRNKKRAARSAADAAIDLAMKYRLTHGFNERYATSAHKAREAKQAEANQESLIEGLIRHVTGDAQLQLSLTKHDRVDIIGDDVLIEVERDLRVGAKLDEGFGQIQRYLDRAHNQGLGVASGFVTDGVEWRYFQRTSEGVHPIGEPFILRDDDADTRRLVGWINDHLGASTEKKTPVPQLIERFLGAKSPTRSGDRLVLADMWKELAHDPEAQLKRSLWAQSLSTALGTQFTNSDDLFVDHTYLVLLAELIANSVVGVNIADPELDITRLVTGAEFAESLRIEGVVEADFFDWPLHSSRAETFIRRLASRVDKFDWSGLEHDALKHLYESVIDAKTRKALGEYYTPDWLARQVVAEVVSEPLGHRVLDPSCGSGTFVFHAVQRYLDAAEEAGVPIGQAVVDVTRSVYGFDLHPVAVALARVTYILAIGTERLGQRSVTDPLQIPVFLADSLRWDVSDTTGTFEQDTLVITVSEHALEGIATFLPGTLEFRFPHRLLEDPASFDKVVTAMHKFAHNKNRDTKTKDTLLRRFKDAGVDSESGELATLVATANNLRSLVERNLDGIWSYYLRNQARPAWLAAQGAEGAGVDYLVGNPPWLSWNSMTGSMQRTFKGMSESRSLWTSGARNHDLSGFFVARAAELYLKRGGRLGFVMPEAILRGRQFKGLRDASWTPHAGKGRGRQPAEVPVDVVLQEPWDVGTLAASFPFPSAVLLGRRTEADEQPGPMPGKAIKLSGKDGTGEAILQERADNAEATYASPWASRFRNGAKLSPRVLLFVDCAAPPRGAPQGLCRVRSARSRLEKDPWSSLPSRSGSMEAEALYRVHLGSTIVPYRPLTPWSAVLPIVGGRFDPDAQSGLALEWWEESSALWEQNRKPSDKKSWAQRIDYFGQLSSQLPLAPYRVVYAKSGVQMAAAVLTQAEVVDEKLYWAPAASLDEARFLTAVLNSETLRERTEAFQSQGLFGARDFDKYIFVNPIPEFDPANRLHRELADLANEAEQLASSVDVSGVNLAGNGFTKARGMVREALAAAGLARAIDVKVAELLDTARLGGRP